MTEKPDYYQVLGVQKTATSEEIDKAYKKIAFFNHPDKVRDKSEPEKKAAVARLEQALEARTVLLDASKRRTYDSYGHAGLANLAAGKGSGTGQSYTDAAGPVRKKEPLTEEGLFDFFDKRKEQSQREAAKNGEPQVSAAERRARAAEERIRAREARKNGGASAPSSSADAPVAPSNPRDEFQETAAKMNEAAFRLRQQGDIAAVPVATLERFRENLQDFIDEIDDAIARAKSIPKNPGQKP